ncbi:TlyA family RNA methyltransferase [Arthrobacter sp. VKM Ac-2550]|uniref:TlyA family RNA methyltransferase n=1 Tax=Crystallibacter permensis TaxID=1938888 RepID=UPI0022271C5F|nr:TlyA family RNA methyltransferase [Arthrobacter sp. VKM Ac-2550]MCW2133216.1 23S rRNA (cytidine1920-2'-O)/16S rRNA (cytidine1409-2'-O)-methyltransferase [Arthrobacter sp. VKM Ac-2550]
MKRLDQELVARGLARSRTHAAKLISAGLVSREGTVVRKVSAAVGADDKLEVETGGEPEYVSRAGHKLAGALRAFPTIDPEGRRCLDAGASTGGFTQVLLEAGAREVAAVDVGHGQMVPQLSADERVHLFEGVNARYLDSADIGGPASLTVADLSFISLSLVMAALSAATEPDGDMVLMVKPQFEVGRESLASTGVVSSEAERRRAVAKVVRSGLEHGLHFKGLARSPLPGQDGNVEFFLWMKVPAMRAPARIGTELDAAVRNAMEQYPEPPDAEQPNELPGVNA